jgi:SNW domain-containing protein 1
MEKRAQLEKHLAQKEKEKDNCLWQIAQKARKELAGITTQVAATDKDGKLESMNWYVVDATKIVSANTTSIELLHTSGQSCTVKKNEISVSRLHWVCQSKTYPARRFSLTHICSTLDYGDDESYNLYDKPWNERGSLGGHIYCPSRNLNKDVYGDDLKQAGQNQSFFAW